MDANDEPMIAVDHVMLRPRQNICTRAHRAPLDIYSTSTYIDIYAYFPLLVSHKLLAVNTASTVFESSRSCTSRTGAHTRLAALALRETELHALRSPRDTTTQRDSLQRTPKGHVSPPVFNSLGNVANAAATVFGRHRLAGRLLLLSPRQDLN